MCFIEQVDLKKLQDLGLLVFVDGMDVVQMSTLWRMLVDRLLEFVPDNKPITFWGWGVDSTGYIFPILGDDSDCERVKFVSPTPK